MGLNYGSFCGPYCPVKRLLAYLQVRVIIQAYKPGRECFVDSYLNESGNFDVKLWAAWAEKRGYLPWQMTLAEYSAFLDRDRKPLAQQTGHVSLQGIALAEQERLSMKRMQLENHKRDVKQAFTAGKSVRAEVLAEYDLGGAVPVPYIAAGIAQAGVSQQNSCGKGL